MEVAQHIERAKVSRVMFDYAFIFVNGRTNLALGNEAFSIPHCL
jgi:hypothetical protein